MVKSGLTNNKYQRAFFPTMYENSQQNQKMALRLAAGVSKLGLGRHFPVWERDSSQGDY
jgi:hypothetical protein